MNDISQKKDSKLVKKLSLKIGNSENQEEEKANNNNSLSDNSCKIY